MKKIFLHVFDPGRCATETSSQAYEKCSSTKMKL